MTTRQRIEAIRQYTLMRASALRHGGPGWVNVVAFANVAVERDRHDCPPTLRIDYRAALLRWDGLHHEPGEGDYALWSHTRKRGLSLAGFKSSAILPRSGAS